MAPPAKQTSKHVFKALRDRRLRSPEQGGVLRRRYLRWRSANAQINAACASVRSCNSTLTDAALITAASASTPEHSTLSDPATPECERAVIPPSHCCCLHRCQRVVVSGGETPKLMGAFLDVS